MAMYGAWYQHSVLRIARYVCGAVYPGLDLGGPFFSCSLALARSLFCSQLHQVVWGHVHFPHEQFLATGF